MNTFVFIFCPPYSGSTLLWALMATSDKVSTFVTEGQFLPEVKNIMRADPWNPDFHLPWKAIKDVWLRYWDLDKPLLLEKSPANLFRTHDIVKCFSPLYSVIMVRNPYAHCEGLMRHFNWGAKRSAKFSLNNLKKQIDNINSLPRSISFTYEDLVENTKNICEKIELFIPEIGNLNYRKKFKIHSIDGTIERGIINLNDRKIKNLSRKSIFAINEIFKEDISALNYWGYEILEPTVAHDFLFLAERIKTKRNLFKIANLRRFNKLKYYNKLFGYKGIYFLTKSKISTDHHLMRIKIPGIKYPVHLRAETSDIKVFERVFTNHTYECNLNDYPHQIIDAGANIGLTSIYYANRYPKAKIFALEPEESNFDLLKVNTAQYDNIIPMKTALWNKNTTLALVPGNGNWGFQTLERGNINAVTIIEMVSGVTVDRFINDNNIQNIDLLKVNIVGSEKEVFEDAARWIDSTKTIIIDLHDWLKTGCSDNFRAATNNFEVKHHFGDNIYLANRKKDFHNLSTSI